MEIKYGIVVSRVTFMWGFWGLFVTPVTYIRCLPIAVISSSDRFEVLLIATHPLGMSEGPLWLLVFLEIAPVFLPVTRSVALVNGVSLIVLVSGCVDTYAVVLIVLDSGLRSAGRGGMLGPNALLTCIRDSDGLVFGVWSAYMILIQRLPSSKK